MPVQQKLEVYALRYASALGRRSEVYHYHHAHGDDDGPVGIDYYFWVVRGPDGIVLVDCGFDADRGSRRSRRHTTPPRALLARLSIRPADVRHVIITHLHYDHVGNLSQFPNATVTLARDEYEYWTRPAALTRRLNRLLVDREDIRSLTEVHSAGRLLLVEGRTEVVPGIVVTPVGGHTPGQIVTEITSGNKVIVLASDAAHFGQEWVLDAPFGLFHDLDDLWAGYDLLHRLDALPHVTVVPGHDPITSEKFAPVDADCFDLLSPITE